MKMKKGFSAIIIILIILGACSDKKSENESNDKAISQDTTIQVNYSFFGKEINAENALALSSPEDILNGKDSLNVKLTGEVSSVCKMKGCWMTLSVPGQTEPLRVTFKDYGFFVPKDIEGKTAVVDGILKKEIEDEATRKHYAKDEGLTAEEIEEIKGDKVVYSFEADGVILI
ncbi:DUF4920 domain-containing protein [Marinigracilibium pacificum]|uniref:DUF4920 domain-containing protein n=1 Tax=Marinigracilibium pacificum TaxID=2729599 RepID=A0A848J4B4_9BACT|nr:DUF4920 domain-containing protein [Marinigracilibium pacificum]NMM48012.1 DUF4920 domain-containing protein [Marinigracilibium pacificum]